VNVRPTLLFSEEMDMGSLDAATNITETRGQTRQVPDWEYSKVGEALYRITFAAALDEETQFTITIGTGATNFDGTRNLASETTITFITGIQVDFVPPEIVYVDPPVGAVVNDDLDEITVRFSEPIMEDLGASRIAGQFLGYMATQQPIFNAAMDEFTMPLITPLPAGVRFFAVLPAGGFFDLAGNPNTKADSLSFTVSGEADYYPVLTTVVYQIFGWEMSSWDRDPSRDEEFTLWRRFENLSGYDFDRAEYESEDLDPLSERNRNYMRKTSAAVQFRGFKDGNGEDITFQPYVDYLPLPPSASWGASADWLVDGQPQGSLDYAGRLLGTMTWAIPESEPPVVWENCWVVEVEHELYDQQQQMMNSGTDTLWYAPGIGEIRYQGLQYDYDEDPPSWWRSITVLTGISWE